MTRHIPMVCLIMAVLSVLAVGCGQDGGVTEVTETRTVKSAPESAPGAVSSAERFGMDMSSAHGGHGGAVASYMWQTPEGWEELPPTSTRMANFQLTERPGVECYLTVLPGSAGGLAANVNRWRHQISLSDVKEAELAELPKVPMLGQEAVLIELEGTYRGMGGEEHLEDCQLLGAVLVTETEAVFVKMVGPAGFLSEERGRFEAFCGSLKPADPHAHAATMDSSVADAGEAFQADALKWEAPSTWTLGPQKMMRVVTFFVGEETECYVSVLRGDAGGLEANVNRWRGQMGMAPADSAEIAALPRVQLVGREAVLVEVAGDFTGMTGSTRPDSMLLGMVCDLPDQTLFVKMTGPKDVILAEKDSFTAFCKSLAYPE